MRAFHMTFFCGDTGRTLQFLAAPAKCDLYLVRFPEALMPPETPLRKVLHFSKHCGTGIGMQPAPDTLHPRPLQLGQEAKQA